MSQGEAQVQQYDVYLITSEDAAEKEWVEVRIAARLIDDEELNPGFYDWFAIGGKRKQQMMTETLKQSKCCAVCLGPAKQTGWDSMLTDLANGLAKDNEQYLVIPVLLPNSNPDDMNDFLKDRELIDFRSDDDFENEFRKLACSIRGKPAGRPPRAAADNGRDEQQQDVEKSRQKLLIKIKVINELEKLEMITEDEAERRRAEAMAQFYEDVDQIVERRPPALQKTIEARL